MKKILMKLINLFAFTKILFIRNLLISKLVVYLMPAIVQMMFKYISCKKRGRSLALVKKGQKMQNQNMNSLSIRKANYLYKSLFLIGIGCLIGSSTTEISASSEPTIEAVAVVEVVSGFKNTYNVGLSFADGPTCVAQIRQLNLVLNNLKAQGVILIDKPVEMTCETSSMLTLK
tara:strand:- start:19 stop:540 length:522 start_codon:yes stop_codon:yes gene_type:complete